MRRWVALAAALALLRASTAWAAYFPEPSPVIGGGTGLATLTAHAVLVGEGTANVALVGPGATAGVPLVSGGASADPSFTTAVVAGGGTGAVTLTAHGVLIGEGTSAVVAIGPVADSALVWTTGAIDPVALSIGSCSAGSSALTYNTSTHAFGCNSITAGAAPSVATAATSASITLSSTNLVTTIVSNTTVATANLPSAVTVGTGWRGCVKDGTEDFNAHNVTLKSPTAGTIDGVAGATGIVMNQTHEELCVISDGANFFIE